MTNWKSLARVLATLVFAATATAFGQGCTIHNYGYGGGLIPAQQRVIALGQAGGAQPATVVVQQPVQPVTVDAPVMAATTRQALLEREAALRAQVQGGPAYVVNANPAYPLGVPPAPNPPGVITMQTNCPPGMPYYVPSTGGCARGAWSTGLPEVPVNSDGTATFGAELLRRYYKGSGSASTPKLHTAA